MISDRNRRLSTSAMPGTVPAESFHDFRSLRTHRSHDQVTKKPEVSVILEDDVDCEAIDKTKITSHAANNQNNSRPVSTNSLKRYKFNSARMSTTRDSRRSTKSTISTKSLNLTKLNRLESGSNQHQHQPHDGGQFNNGLQSSDVNLNRSTSSLQSTTTATIIREQYFCCRKWSRREKILTTVVLTLAVLICGLIIVIGIIADRT